MKKTLVLSLLLLTLASLHASLVPHVAVGGGVRTLHHEGGLWSSPVTRMECSLPSFGVGNVVFSFPLELDMASTSGTRGGCRVPRSFAVGLGFGLDYNGHIFGLGGAFSAFYEGFPEELGGNVYLGGALETFLRLLPELDLGIRGSVEFRPMGLSHTLSLFLKASGRIL